MLPHLEILPTEDPRSFRLAGEIDLANADGLVERLAPIASAPDGDLRLDVGEVTFIDSMGLYGLVRIAGMLPSGSRLVLVRASPALLRVLELTGLSDTPGLTVEDEPHA